MKRLIHVGSNARDARDSCAATRLVPLTGILVPLVLAACAAPSPSVQPQIERRPWDVQRMTELTGQLAHAVQDLRRVWSTGPVYNNPRGIFRQNARRLGRTLSRLEESTTQLHGQVRSGAGFEETRDIVHEIRTTLTDVDAKARNIRSGHWVARWERPTLLLINEIAPFYGEGPLVDPEILQRIDRPPHWQ